MIQIKTRPYEDSADSPHSGENRGLGMADAVPASASIGSRFTTSDILLPLSERKNVWLTTACGQRLSINQIGSLFGRE